ncbi:hypothetical protein EV356DRAFT_448274 [Viridothelium virens]|uniref:Uncharacterized protein n=1 Tax=Viridothelium virens TaxID=1048519 RepID=A0A6A6H6H9_VIRVR|nr:hypothetical protein EV356DRAFT_448274 [Viridothelium virens]
MTASPVSTKPQTFHYQRIYGEVPSNTSDAAWSTLFPIQGGFFKHPSLAPQRSAFSVFHQLHCLDGIRHGYWAIYSAAITGHQISEEDIPFMSSPPHIRHCIDLIRQSLMCQPDLTVELKEKELGGVTGFGTEHQCRDWGELLNWLEEWEGWAQDPKDGDNEHVHHDHNH